MNRADVVEAPGIEPGPNPGKRLLSRDLSADVVWIHVDPRRSSYFAFSIVGGAVVPLLVGLVSGATSYATAFIVPAACYALLLGFGLAPRGAAVIRSGKAVPAAGH